MMISIMDRTFIIDVKKKLEKRKTCLMCNVFQARCIECHRILSVLRKWLVKGTNVNWRDQRDQNGRLHSRVVLSVLRSQ